MLGIIVRSLLLVRLLDLRNLLNLRHLLGLRNLWDLRLVVDRLTLGIDLLLRMESRCDWRRDENGTLLGCECRDQERLGKTGVWVSWEWRPIVGSAAFESAGSRHLSGSFYVDGRVGRSRGSVL